MPRGRPRQTPEPVEEPTKIVVELSHLDLALNRQADLLSLRTAMLSEGVDSLSKLDVLLGQANEEVRRLS